MPEGERKRRIARCRSCSSAYAVNVWTDGTIRPIGRPCCDCGSTEFEVFDDPTALEGDSVD